MDPNQWHVRMTMRVPSFYEEYQMFNFTLYSMNSDDEMCYLWPTRPDISNEGIHILKKMVFDEPLMLYPDVEEDDDANADYDVSSAYENNDDNDGEDDISTPVNPLSSTIMNQWQSSQWFSNAPCGYTLSGIDDLIESGTISLLDWNEAITDLQLGMRNLERERASKRKRKPSALKEEAAALGKEELRGETAAAVQAIARAAEDRKKTEAVAEIGNSCSRNLRRVVGDRSSRTTEELAAEKFGQRSKKSDSNRKNLPEREEIRQQLQVEKSMIYSKKLVPAFLLSMN
ncbi:hypothetical protein M9H77_17761 [Catharanthus roseus]|uniref:Uncharacterized protein n=1 Tax=Catharanthus roseus TaxID=4058 RepID=A0ACC0B5I2_CATRO|nr:hypothetical protein M9H77_17761 [Catharanthus roseus]